jgi:hypothetical protein
MSPRKLEGCDGLNHQRRHPTMRQGSQELQESPAGADIDPTAHRASSAAQWLGSSAKLAAAAVV